MLDNIIKDYYDTFGVEYQNTKKPEQVRLRCALFSALKGYYSTTEVGAKLNISHSIVARHQRNHNKNLKSMNGYGHVYKVATEIVSKHFNND